MYNTQSINDRLKNLAKEHGFENVERVRVLLCLERITARLMQDRFLKQHLIFGGGFVLYKQVESDRFTRDIDAVVSGIDVKKLVVKVEKCLQKNLKDGFWFGNSIIEEIKTESGYGGIRFKIEYKAGLPHPTKDEFKRLRRIHLDISIGVDLEKQAKNVSLKPLLDIYEAIDWKVYPIEFICAEKIHCLLYRKDFNTRGKDVYDLHFLLAKSNKKKLISAINKTFKNRDFKVASLYKEAISIDTKNLEENFKKSQFKKKSESFSKCWKDIMFYLKELDEFF